MKRQIYNSKYIINDNNRYQVLTDETLNRILSKHSITGYCIVSACRNDIKIDGITKLKEMIIESNFSFLPVFGGYKERKISLDNSGNEIISYETVFEKSFIIFNFNRAGQELSFNTLIKKCIEFGKYFNQDTILIKAPNEVPYYFDIIENKKSYEFTADSSKWKINDVTQEYFTALKKWDENSMTQGKPQRFTFENLYIEDSPSTVMNKSLKYYTGELFI